MSNPIGKTITATGYIWNFDYMSPRYGEYKVDMNMSEIYSILIQEAGRWCESYASDLLVDIDTVKFALNYPAKWNEMRQYEKGENGVERVSFRFGFRANGVDHREYIDYAMKNEHEKYHYYRSIWELVIERKDGPESRTYKATMKRVA